MEKHYVVEKIIDDLFDGLYSPESMNKLVSKDTDEYDKGFMAGKIWMLTKIAQEFASVGIEDIQE